VSGAAGAAIGRRGARAAGRALVWMMSACEATSSSVCGRYLSDQGRSEETLAAIFKRAIVIVSSTGRRLPGFAAPLGFGDWLLDLAGDD
jgi:hypothetical protein